MTPIEMRLLIQTPTGTLVDYPQMYETRHLDLSKHRQQVKLLSRAREMRGILFVEKKKRGLRWTKSKSDLVHYLVSEPNPELLV